MKRLPVLMLVVLAVASMVWVAGCSSPETPQPGTNIDEIINREESPDLNDPFGGYNMKDEAPAFGDPEMLSEFAEDEDYADPFAARPEIIDIENRQTHRLFLMITWGNLHRDSTIQHWTDWSGGLSVDPGVLLLKQTIRFEPSDRILPRTQRDLIEWESQTRPHFDGILVKILPLPAPTAVDSTIDSTNTIITFATGPVTVEFTLNELPGLHRVITLADGNAVAFNAVFIPPFPCPHGFLGGLWLNDPERPGGVFFGKWATENGRVRGFLKGIYGQNDQGQNVFFGKMIDVTGRFEGIIRGQYGRHPDQENGGWFAGRWVDRRLHIRGGLRGEWRRSNRCHGGFFRGVWAMHCNV